MKEYWWFQGTSVRELADQLEAKGADTARLEVRIDDDGAMTFRVVPGNRAGKVSDDSVDSLSGPINDSHRCPPDCP